MPDRLRRWLGGITVHDPIERQQAVFLQSMLIGLTIIGLLGVPVSLAAQFDQLGTALTITADLLLALISAGALLLLRRGRFKLAVLAGVGGLLFAIALSYFTIGTSAGEEVLIIFTLPITMAGLLAGRRGLFFALATSIFIVVGTTLIDLRTVSYSGLDMPEDLPLVVVFGVFILVTSSLGLFLDRFGAALRASITSMQGRERELEQSRAALELRTRELEREIADRQRAEAALRESDDMFRALVTHSPVGIYRTGPDGACQFVNKNWSELTGITLEQALGWGWTATLHPDDRERVETEWNTAIASGQQFSQEYRFLNRQGQVRWVFGSATALRDDAGAVLGYFGIISDITGTKRASEALRASEARYRLLAENTLDLISLFDLDDNRRRIYTSPSYATVLGYDLAQLAGSNWDWLVHQEDQELINSLMTELFTHHQASASIRLRHADGSWRWFDAQANIFQQDGRAYVITVSRDITERKRLEAQLLQAQKMESIGRLAGGIAHDFNNLLTAILGNADLALDALPPDHPVRPDMIEIGRSAERASALTRQLLAFARKQIIEPHVLDPHRLILDMSALLRRLIGEDIELLTQTEPQLWRIKGDPGQIEQVIINLAVNARDAMPGGGKLIIETKNVAFDEEYARQHVGISPGSYVMLAISDTGVGMDEETQRHAFEPFFTTKAQGRGTGLGLATCYGIVKQHGGSIWLYSEIEHGSTFRIYLPGINEPAEDRPAESPPSQVVGGSETILLVEDEPAVRALAARILRELGYTVIEASQGREAIEYVRANPAGAFELLITDVVMPHMSGKALAEQLYSADRDFKVLFISGYTDHAIVHHGQLDPGIQFLHKPFTPSGLARRVREVLGSKETQSNVG
jgi:PAS domain S-box-containing protein